MTALRLLGYAWFIVSLIGAMAVGFALRDAFDRWRDRRKMWAEVRGLERLGEGGAG